MLLPVVFRRQRQRQRQQFVFGKGRRRLTHKVKSKTILHYSLPSQHAYWHSKRHNFSTVTACLQLARPTAHQSARLHARPIARAPACPPPAHPHHNTAQLLTVVTRRASKFKGHQIGRCPYLLKTQSGYFYREFSRRKRCAANNSYPVN